MPGPVYVFKCRDCGNVVEVDKHGKESIEAGRWACANYVGPEDEFGEDVCYGEYRRVWHPAAHTWHADFR